MDQVAQEGLVADAGDLHGKDAHADECAEGAEPREHADNQEGGVVRHEGGDQSADSRHEGGEEYDPLPSKPVTEVSRNENPEDKAHTEKVKLSDKIIIIICTNLFMV